MSKPQLLSDLEKDYEELKRQISRLGVMAQGTIISRSILRPDPEDRRKNKSYGPYYQWTWKKLGRTVTVNLTASQAKEFKKAIATHRKLERLLKEMRRLSLQILERSGPGVAKRTKRSAIHTLK